MEKTTLNATPGPKDGLTNDSAQQPCRSRLRRLQAVERERQSIWNERKVHQIDPQPGQEKFFATFPYPYMNGLLHLGHLFSLSKAEFAVRFERMLGKRAVLPFGLHVTGMPIAGAAHKLRQELREGQSTETTQTTQTSHTTHTSLPSKQEEGGDSVKIDLLAYHGKKSKHTTKKSQFEIMSMMGIEEKDIPKFTDPVHWLEYFPQKGLQSLDRAGIGYDSRRSFYTTEENPFYDSFVRWQFNRLKSRDRLKFGKRYTIFSPQTDQPCQDHDRLQGEGVKPQEYTLIKLLVQDYSQNSALEQHRDLIRDLTVVLPCATLRPETMFGQTNCWVSPDGEYGAYRVSEKEIFITSPRSMHNLAWQGWIYPEEQKNPLSPPQPLFTIKGRELLGTRLSAPMSPYKTIYVLPMPSIKLNRGTGVVTSVPSDSPDDFINFTTLKSKPEWRKTEYGIKDEWIDPFDIVPIITYKEEGVMGEPRSRSAFFPHSYAETCCKQFKIQSTKDADKLEEAKKECYLKGFNYGLLWCPQDERYHLQAIRDVKNVIRDQLISDGLALHYAEPEKTVISRSGEECIVTLSDQWFLNYGEEEWRGLVEDHLQSDRMKFFNDSTKRAFKEALDWIQEWPCSRTFGLGSRLPWDCASLIDSLSDSTVYMAYYTIVHYLQSDLSGRELGPHGIKPEDMTDQVYDYLFLGKEEGLVEPTLPRHLLDKMREEFLYWYPMDLRCSGKDLITNHLTMCLYNHASIWDGDGEMMPKAFFTNGHIQVDSEKMAKSLGNFYTVDQAVEEFGADPLRLALAEAGDGIDDANFSRKTANDHVLRLTRELDWIEQSINLLKEDKLRTGEFEFFDKVLLAAIDRAVVASRRGYESMMFREVVMSAFYDLTNARDIYRQVYGEQLHSQVVKRYIETQMLLLTPIIPHFTDHVWCNILGHSELIIDAAFPAAKIDSKMEFTSKFLDDCVQSWRTQRARQKGEKSKSLTVVVMTDYSELQRLVLGYARECFQQTRKVVRDCERLRQSLPELDKRSIPIAMGFLAWLERLVNQAVENGDVEGADLFLSDQPFIDQYAILSEMKEYLSKMLEVDLDKVIIERYSLEQHGPKKSPQIYKPVIF